MTPNVSRVLQSKRLARQPAVKLLWLWAAPDLSDSPRPIKIGLTAEGLGVKRATIRRALRLLTEMGYLHCTTPATAGTAGEYVLGPRAL